MRTGTGSVTRQDLQLATNPNFQHYTPATELVLTIHIFHYHRITEQFGLEGTIKVHPVQLLSNKQGHLQLDQAAQSPVKPDYECFQGWGTQWLRLWGHTGFHQPLTDWLQLPVLRISHSKADTTLTSCSLRPFFTFKPWASCLKENQQFFYCASTVYSFLLPPITFSKLLWLSFREALQKLLCRGKAQIFSADTEVV